MVTIAFGRVVHRRLRPLRHGFAYPVFFLRIPLHEMARLPGRGVALDRFGLFSFMRRDFGPRDGGDLEAWARALLRRHGVSGADGDIVLQAFPRMLGYAFNPIAVWYCHDREGALRAAICEVRNTFGERHNYLVREAGGGPIAADRWLAADKVFHVSPFCEVEGHYRFRFADRPGLARLVIDYHDATGPLLATAIAGREEPLTRRALLRAFFAYPLMTFAVIARIHGQAFLLWAKRVPFHRKPAPPLEETTP